MREIAINKSWNYGSILSQIGKIISQKCVLVVNKGLVKLQLHSVFVSMNKLPNFSKHTNKQV